MSLSNLITKKMSVKFIEALKNIEIVLICNFASILQLCIFQIVPIISVLQPYVDCIMFYVGLFGQPILLCIISAQQNLKAISTIYELPLIVHKYCSEEEQIEWKWILLTYVYISTMYNICGSTESSVK